MEWKYFCDKCPQLVKYYLERGTFVGRRSYKIKVYDFEVGEECYHRRVFEKDSTQNILLEYGVTSMDLVQSPEDTRFANYFASPGEITSFRTYLVLL